MRYHRPVTRRRFLSACGAASGLASTIQAQSYKTKNLILVTSDGLRWQELFSGIDPRLMNEKAAGMTKAHTAELRARLWKPRPEDRRLALMPYFWGTLAPAGIVLGNVTKGSSVKVTNRYRGSYPGYAEILTGRAQDDVIHGNEPVQNPTPSFLEFARQKWHVPRQKVAVFGSWEMFHYIAESRRGEIFINAGYEACDVPAGSPVVDELNKLQLEARFGDGARHDAFTFGLAMEYLKNVAPRLFYMAFDETDDWAHVRQYAEVLHSIQFVDDALRELWTWVQNSPAYRDSTTLIVTCDHGRGSTLSDWYSHGQDVEGSDETWIAAIGPDTPATGEATHAATYYQRDLAPTALELLGLGGGGYAGMLGKPIDPILGSRT